MLSLVILILIPLVYHKLGTFHFNQIAQSNNHILSYLTLCNFLYFAIKPRNLSHMNTETKHLADDFYLRFCQQCNYTPGAIAPKFDYKPGPFCIVNNEPLLDVDSRYFKLTAQPNEQHRKSYNVERRLVAGGNLTIEPVEGPYRAMPADKTYEAKVTLVRIPAGATSTIEEPVNIWPAVDGLSGTSTRKWDIAMNRFLFDDLYITTIHSKYKVCLRFEIFILTKNQDGTVSKKRHQTLCSTAFNVLPKLRKRKEEDRANA
jgi:hypothetical protein